jgi:hypothetical protein
MRLAQDLQGNSIASDADESFVLVGSVLINIIAYLGGSILVVSEAVEAGTVVGCASPRTCFW